jgi:hypothetical protein
MAGGMHRVAALIGLVIGLGSFAPIAVAAPAVQHSGQVTGDLSPGKVVTVHISISHPQGWQSVQSVEVALRLRGRTLDEIEFTASELSLSIAGDGGPVVLGQPGTLHGSFFRVDNSKVALQASGKRLGLTMPITLTAAPPPGGRLFYTYSALGVPAPGFLPITPPVKAKAGFSWGTLGLAVAVALFAGGFVGNMVASNRRRQQGPSVYAAVARRLEEERARR